MWASNILLLCETNIKFFLAWWIMTGFGVNKNWVMSFKGRSVNLSIFLNSINENLVYAGQYRNFYNSSGSEDILVGRCANDTLVMYELKICEVLQLDSNFRQYYCMALKLFKCYAKWISRASIKVWQIFTLVNLICAYSKFYYLIEIVNKYAKGISALTLPIYKNLCDPCFLLIAYSSLKNKKANGVNNFFFESVPLASIISLSLELEIKSYLPDTVKKILISKTNRKNILLSIVSIRDKIVQQVLKLVLEPLFKNVFVDSWHDLRKNVSCHSVLKFIYYKWRDVKWFITCNFVKYLNRSNYLILLNVFNKYVNDYWTSILISRFMAKGYVFFANFCDSFWEFKINLYEGFFISPIISNIFLYELDVFIESYCSAYFNIFSTKYLGECRELLFCKNISWKFLWKCVQSIIYKNVPSVKLWNVFWIIRKFEIVARSIRKMWDDFSVKKINYVRYANCFILGVISDKEFGCKLLGRISLISNALGVLFNIDRTYIKHHEKGTLFLGYYIYSNYGFSFKWAKDKLRCVTNLTLNFVIPLKRLVRNKVFNRIEMNYFLFWSYTLRSSGLGSFVRECRT